MTMKDCMRNTRDLAKFITDLESRSPAALRRLAGLYSRKSKTVSNGASRIIGVTGPPGAGKSTIVDGIISFLRKDGNEVGVVAIDPSSPFSGGAVLGDRIRMQKHAGDTGVFIRSLGSRGSHGGLSLATRDIISAMAAYGMDYVIVETVGVGQTELDIMEIADVTLVVLVPESGDMIQTMKAGLLEIADIFVVNKADRPGAEQMKQWLAGIFDSGACFDAETIKHHGNPPGGFESTSPPLKKGGRGGFEQTPVLLTQANAGKGIGELMAAVDRHLELTKFDKSRKQRKADIRRLEFLDICAEEFKARLIEMVDKDKGLKKLVSEVMNGVKSPYEALKVIDKFMKFGGHSRSVCRPLKKVPAARRQPRPDRDVL